MKSFKPFASAFGQLGGFLFVGALLISALSVLLAWLLQFWLGPADAVIWGALLGIPLLLLLGWFAPNSRQIHQLHRYWGLTFLALFTVVWSSGTFSYYRAELDLWSWSAQQVASSVDASLSPDTAASAMAVSPASQRLAIAELLGPLAKVQQHLANNAAQAQTWYIELPTERKPVFVLHWSQADYRLYQQVLNLQAQPITAIVPASAVASQPLGTWFFQLHYTLFGIFGAISRYVVAFAAGFLLVICCSGMRLWWQQRAIAHQHPNRLRWHLWGGLALFPAVLLLACSALVTMIWQINPAPLTALYGPQSQQFYQTLFPWQALKPATTMVDSPPDLAKILANHHQFAVGKIQVQHPFADTSEVLLTQDAATQVSNQLASQRYDRFAQPLATLASYQSAAMTTRSVSYGLHQALFASPSLRLLLASASALLLVVLWLGLRSWQTRRRIKGYWRIGFSCILPGLPLVMFAMTVLTFLQIRGLRLDLSHHQMFWLLFCCYAVVRAIGLFLQQRITAYPSTSDYQSSEKGG